MKFLTHTLAFLGGIALMSVAGAAYTHAILHDVKSLRIQLEEGVSSTSGPFLLGPGEAFRCTPMQIGDKAFSACWVK